MHAPVPTALRRGSVAAGTVILAVVLSSCDGEPPGARPRPSATATLAACPDLRAGQQDPVGGMDCVRLLQQALRAHGYPQQPITGGFRDVTAANVRSFQKARGIRPVSGVAGPQTRRALTGSGPGSATGPARGAVCSAGRCRVYLDRAVTARYSALAAAHPRATGIATSTAANTACALLRLGGGIPRFLCEFAGGNIAERVVTQLTAAAGQSACLRFTLSFPVANAPLRLLDVSPDHSSHCS